MDICGSFATIGVKMPAPSETDAEAMRWIYPELQKLNRAMERRLAQMRNGEFKPFNPLTDECEHVDWLELRDKYVRRYGWALASAALLDRLELEIRAVAAAVAAANKGGDANPVLSVCAGRAYLEYELRKRGVNILAYDTDFGQPRHRQYLAHYAYMPVNYDGALQAVIDWPESDLLVVWPPHQDHAGDQTWQEKMLRLSNCARVYYVGEPAGDSTGSDDFHGALDDLFDVADEVEIATWWGMNDRLMIYDRKGRKGLSLALP